MGQLLAMCQAFRASPALATTTDRPEPPALDTTRLAALVRGGRKYLLADYRQPYADALIGALGNGTYRQALATQRAQDLANGYTEAEARLDEGKVADAAIGAVTDWEPGQGDLADLSRFKAVVDHICQKFASVTEQAGLTPLVTFAPTLRWGPHTINPQMSHAITGSDIAVVSMPYSYSDQPLMWTALAHEVGGHDSLHRSPNIIPELQTLLRQDPNRPTPLRDWGDVWASFTEEATADVCGILGMGPSFAISLLAWLSAVPAQPFSGPVPVLGNVRTGYRTRGEQVIDDHPPDLLRIYAAMGVVQALPSFSARNKQRWLKVLQDAATQAAGTATTISRYDPGYNLVVQYPLTELADVAQQAGCYIASAKLAALGGKALQDIAAWTDNDETAAEAVASAAGTPVGKLAATPLQLLAGATMALYGNVAGYARLTKLLVRSLPVCDGANRPPTRGWRRD
jgi:hypothetical protein